MAESVKPLVDQIKNDISKLEAAGGDSFSAKGALRSALEALKNDLYKLDGTLGACSYTFGKMNLK